jgi:hypothetical protein
MDKTGADARREKNPFSEPSRAKLVGAPKELTAARHPMDLPDERGSALAAAATTAGPAAIRSGLGRFSGRALVVP